MSFFGTVKQDYGRKIKQVTGYTLIVLLSFVNCNKMIYKTLSFYFLSRDKTV